MTDMIELNFNKYRVEIFPDDLYTPNSADNVRKYDYVYSSGNETDDSYRYYPKFGINIWEDDDLYKSAILLSGGTGYSPHKKSAVTDNDNLVIILGDSIISIYLPDILLNWFTVCENCGSCFELYKVIDGYIIHGELSILKIDKNGSIVWEFFGGEIFTALHGSDFQVREDYVIAEDWTHRIYKIDITNGIEIK